MTRRYCLHCREPAEDRGLCKKHLQQLTNAVQHYGESWKHAELCKQCLPKRKPPKRKS